MTNYKNIVSSILETIEPKKKKDCKNKGKKDYKMTESVLKEDFNFTEQNILIKDKLEYHFEDVVSDSEAQEAKYEDVENKSRDGFWAWTDGGTLATSFAYISRFQGGGFTFSDDKANKILQQVIDTNYEGAKGSFMERNQDLVTKYGEDKMNYSDLYELGLDEKAEDLSETESEWMDETIMLQMGVQYYTPKNSRNENAGKHTFYVYGVINFEAPYHRSKSEWESHKDVTFSVDSLDDPSFESKLESAIKTVKAIF